MCVSGAYSHLQRLSGYPHDSAWGRLVSAQAGFAVRIPATSRERSMKSSGRAEGSLKVNGVMRACAKPDGKVVLRDVYTTSMSGG